MKGGKQIDPEKAVVDWVAKANEAGGLPDDPFPKWVSASSGWDTVSDPTPNKIANAIYQVLSPKYEIAPTALVHHARAIYATSLQAQEQRKPRYRRSSASGADKQLKKLHDLSNKLAATMGELNWPATKALQRHGVEPQIICEQLDRLSEAVRGAAGDVEGTNEVGGRPLNQEAFSVTYEVASVYVAITGRQPTFTKDPVSNLVSGVWPSLLSAVFDVLSIGSSIEDQVRKLNDLLKASDKPPVPLHPSSGWVDSGLVDDD